MIDLQQTHYLAQNPRGLKAIDSNWLYYLPEYWSNQSQKLDQSFYLVEHASQTIQAQVHFSRSQDQAISTQCSPFGSIESDHMAPEVAAWFLGSIEERLRSYGIKELILRHPIEIYQRQKFWAAIIRNAGYARRDQVNHHIPVTPDPFWVKIHDMQRRKLKSSSAFTFKFCPSDQLRLVYDFIARCRKHKGHQLSMTHSALNQIVSALPEYFLLPTVWLNGQLVAAAIVIKATGNVWYNFYPAHDTEYNHLSPMVYLLKRLYQHAQQEQVEALDLGTSEFQGQLIPGLAQFKSRVGGVESLKTTFSKSIL